MLTQIFIQVLNKHIKKISLENYVHLYNGLCLNKNCTDRNNTILKAMRLSSYLKAKKDLLKSIIYV